MIISSFFDMPRWFFEAPSGDDAPNVVVVVVGGETCFGCTTLPPPGVTIIASGDVSWPTFTRTSVGEVSGSAVGAVIGNSSGVVCSEVVSTSGAVVAVGVTGGTSSTATVSGGATPTEVSGVIGSGAGVDGVICSGAGGSASGESGCFSEGLLESWGSFGFILSSYTLHRAYVLLLILYAVLPQEKTASKADCYSKLTTFQRVEYASTRYCRFDCNIFVISSETASRYSGDI